MRPWSHPQLSSSYGCLDLTSGVLNLSGFKGKTTLTISFPGATLSNLKDLTGATLIDLEVLKAESYFLLGLATRLNFNQLLSLKDVLSFIVWKSESIPSSSPFSPHSSRQLYSLPSLQNGQFFAKLNFLLN